MRFLIDPLFIYDCNRNFCTKAWASFCSNKSGICTDCNLYLCRRKDSKIKPTLEGRGGRIVCFLKEVEI